MNKPDGYVGTLSITWEDGEKNVVEISQKDSQIWVGGHVVSPRNEKSFQGILREISEVLGSPPRKVKQYTWLELIQPLRYPK
jgi:hypothetical protein